MFPLPQVSALISPMVGAVVLALAITGCGEKEVPSARWGHAMATLGTNIVLFGGAGPPGEYNLPNALADTWEWDGTNWNERSTVNLPPNRSGHAMVSMKNRVVMFGGSQWLSSLTDTWEWEGKGWTRASPTLQPQAEFPRMAMQGTTVLLFGGRSFSCSPQTWAWDGAEWTTLAPAIQPPCRSSYAMTTLGEKVVLFGGSSLTDPLDIETRVLRADTWEWDGTNWTQRMPATSPPARSGHAMTTLGEKVVLFGGSNGSSLSDTWEWDGETWTEVSPSPSPPARASHAMATLGDKVVLFGGLAAGSELSDTWEWDGTTWTPR